MSYCDTPSAIGYTVKWKKKNTQHQYSEWLDEAIRLAKSRRYKNKMDICRAIKNRIAVDEGVSFTAIHICRSIKISAAEFSEIIESSQPRKNS